MGMISVDDDSVRSSEVPPTIYGIEGRSSKSNLEAPQTEETADLPFLAPQVEPVVKQSKNKRKKGPKDTGLTWEFELSGGRYKAFAKDCQSYIEEKYQEYLEEDRNHQILVSTSDIKLSIDFQKMTQMKIDSKRVSRIRRVA